MSSTPVSSIKSNFDFTSFTENDLQDKINDLTSLDRDREKDSLLKLLIKLDDKLAVYKALSDKNADAQQIQFSEIIDLLQEINIDDNKSLMLFNYLFGYYENNIYLPEAIALDNLINVLTVIDKFFANPRLPWPKVNGFLLFNEQAEEELIKPGTHDINKDHFYGRVNIFNSEEDIIISNLQTPAYNSRKNDIYKLFVNLKIAQCINKTPNIEYLNLENFEIRKKIESWELKDKNSKLIDLDKYVTELFKKVYQHTEREIKEQILVPKNVDIDHILWESLLTQANIIRKQLLKMQSKYKNILDHFEAGGGRKELLERNKLLIELRNFLNTNKTKKEYLSLKINERFMPDRNAIEAITGGKGLMKRISVLEGGVVKFKRIYPQWIAKKLDKESAKALVNKKLKKYERRYTSANYNKENMTLENKPVEEI